MALIFPHHSQSPLRSSLNKPLSCFNLRGKPFIPNLSSSASFSNPRPTLPSLTSRAPPVSPLSPLVKTLTSTCASSPASSDTAFELDGLAGDEDLAASPWEGALVYRRDASAGHVEYCTTLERLGLGRLSTGLSKSRASEMGIRVPVRMAKSSVSGDAETPVLVSVDVTRRKRRLKLDGILRTVITLGCNRCGEPAAESVFSNFTLLLTEDPIEEPDEIDMGVMFGKDKSMGISGNGKKGEEEDDEKEIDLDDRLYFPAEEREIDISKHVRDLVHVEITINAVCDASCRGLCLECGTNLNKGGCRCGEDPPSHGKVYGPLQGLGKQMQQS